MLESRIELSECIKAQHGQSDSASGERGKSFSLGDAKEYVSDLDLLRLSDRTVIPQKRLFRFLYPKKVPHIPEPSERKVYPIFKVNIISRIWFFWLIPLLLVGYRRTVQHDDLWLLDERLSVETLHKRFMFHLEAYRISARKRYALKYPQASNEQVVLNAKLRDYDLLKALFKTFRFVYLRSTLFILIGTCIHCIEPIVLRKLLEAQSLHQKAKSLGFLSLSCLFSLVFGVLFNHFMQDSSVTGVQVNTVLTRAMLDKSMRLSRSSRNEWPSGKINSLIGTDLSRLEFAAIFQPMLVSFLPAIIITIIYLVYTLGPSALVGYGVFLLVLLIFGVSVRSMMKFRISANEHTDSRVTLIKEILNSVRMLKFYAWEDAYENLVQAERKLELHSIKYIQYLRSTMSAVTLSVPAFASLLTFAFVNLVNGERLTAAIIFSVFGMFQSQNIALFFLPIALGTASDSVVTLKRVQAFLEAEEEPSDTRKLGFATDPVAIKVIDASFEWEFPDNDNKHSNVCSYDFKSFKSPSFNSFNNLNFEINRGELVLITGVIGTGKTSLINALAGIMKKSSGDTIINGELLYCGYPWLQNSTIRDNITFGSPYDENRYREVIRVCSLENDLKVLLHKDLTEVGERGINLSGGQKSRVNLARCIYKDCDIYLLDDVFSAVDSQVVHHIMHECIEGYLANKTRVIATHQISMVKSADKVIFLGTDGSVNFGSIEELKSKHQEFNNLFEMSTSKKHEVDHDDIQAIEDGDKSLAPYDFLSSNSSPEHVHKQSLTEDDSESNDWIEKDYELQQGSVEREVRGESSVSFSVYKQYFFAGFGKNTVFFVAFFFLIVISTTFFEFFYSILLSYWSENKFSKLSGAHYMGLCLIFSILGYLLKNVEFMLICYMGINASMNLGFKALHRVIHSSVIFLDTTPVGRILNRFTKDTNSLDNEMTEFLRLFIYQSSLFVGVIILSVVYVPWSALAVPGFLLAYLVIADLFQCTSREIKRIESVERSFVRNNINEVLGGLETLRSYNAQARFLKKAAYLGDKLNESSYVLIALQRWVALFVDLIAVIFTFLIGSLCVFGVFGVSTASTGVLLTQVIHLPGILNTLLRCTTQMDLNMNSAERMLEYANDLPIEAPYRIPELQPPQSWPESADITFSNVSVSYRPGLPLVLSGLSFQIKSGEKIGICGRTGAGKSTIMSALYRIIELQSGSIEIGGLDISKIGLYDLRSRFSIIPQDPVLFKGDIRKNLDPFLGHTDDQLWSALVRSGVIDEKEIEDVKKQKLDGNTKLHKFHLSQVVDEDGNNFSLGERQLLSLARALVRLSKVLILDEATSSVDFKTDLRIQRCINFEFANSTVLCIAHRLKTILHYGRILVLSRGKIEGFDTPINLFKHNKVFHDMCVYAGISESDF